MVVFLVAIPLCLGIALASGAPAISGIISGIIGGMVVTIISGSALSVSGPAAGLTAIVAAGIVSVGSYEAFLVSVVIAGFMQIIFGIFKLGFVAKYFPNAVIKGMLAAIGLTLILKQIPHALGYDKDFEGDESFVEEDGQNTFSTLIEAFEHPAAGAVIISLLCLLILVIWQIPLIRKSLFSKIISGPLAVVATGIMVNALPFMDGMGWTLAGDHLVQLPVTESGDQLLSSLQTPDWSVIWVQKEIWILALSIALVASIETLLSIEAVDRIDPEKRISPPNKELLAQGTGNMVSGLIGGLPLTAVIVRSSANVTAGGKTQWSAFLHGLLLLLAFLLFPNLLNKIPNAALAVILLLVGYKLVKVELFKEMYRMGWEQFVPFMVTIIAIMFSDLLIGIGIGTLTGMYFVLRTNFRRAVYLTSEGNNYLLKLNKDVSFLNKPIIRHYLHQIPDGTFVLIEASKAEFIDKDILQELNEFIRQSADRNITLELKGFHKKYHGIISTPPTGE